MQFKTKMSPTFFWSEAFLLCSVLVHCFAGDSITLNNILSDETQDSLISAGEKFTLGFFTPPGGSGRYIGIWYYKLEPQTVVWVANRDNPILDNSGALAVDSTGLKILNGTGQTLWYAEVENSSSASYEERRAILLDSGNFILSDDHGATSLWQSFEHPTDTFLLGMKMDMNFNLTSWHRAFDPKMGTYTFTLDHEDKKQFIIKKGVANYWRSGKSTDFSSDEMPPGMNVLLSNFTNKNSSGPSLLFNTTSSLLFNTTRVVLNYNGQIQQWKLDVQKKEWSLAWYEPTDICSVSKTCGNFGSCNGYSNLACRCLPGFKPNYLEEWNNRTFKDGCSRKSATCGNRFLRLTMMKVNEPDSSYFEETESACTNKCLDNDCQCIAYSYYGGNNTRRGVDSNCFIWINDLYDLREGVMNGGHTLSVRVADSDIETTSRSCEPCGTNLIPYPLSNGSNCGDPTYSSFLCDKSVGKLSFRALNGTYDVISVNPENRTFIVLVHLNNRKYKCNTYSREEVMRIDQSLPFRKKGIAYFCDSGASTAEIEIEWEPPVEPTCNSSADCRDWPKSTCNVAKDGTKRCLCSTNFNWDQSELNCTQEEKSVVNGTTVTSERSSGRKTAVVLIVGVSAASVILFVFAIVSVCIWRKRVLKGQGSRDTTLLYGTEKKVKYLIEREEFKEEDKKDIDVPFFSWNNILAATDNFVDANKLGRGGFGPVYKGKLPGGQEIAIKRLSSASVQGLEEFKNEVVLIAKLQHRNLVKLLGYCIIGDEKILIYEYMPNKSLDNFIFDKELSMILNWEMRFNIILGIARGLLYLHQDSRLRIIHRDLKTSNILLDQEMNPKISDFGLAKIFEGKQTEGSTKRVMGTYGYMSPEYALDGLFSVKSDVFSFGVVVLEILSGKKNTGYFWSDQSSRLLGYAWGLWREDKALELMDETLRESCDADEFLKCVNVALLCVQDDPSDRPTMSNVVVMLSSENVTFPTPNQPAFIVKNSFTPADSLSSKQEIIADSSNSFGGPSSISTG